MLAEPEWVNKIRRAEPQRRCLACNTCVNEMRGGAPLRCVVNGAAGDETRLTSAPNVEGENIAVIGAGPAGLTYASLVAGKNIVTVFERQKRPGGAFRYAGRALLFQDVSANQATFDQYIDAQVAACKHRGVTFRYDLDVMARPQLLEPFDRVVIATGATYRFGLGSLFELMLRVGVGKWPGIAQVLSAPRLREWFYYKGRVATGEIYRNLLKSDQTIVVIGDAIRAGKSRAAIKSAFEAALAPSAAAPLVAEGTRV